MIYNSNMQALVMCFFKKQLTISKLSYPKPRDCIKKLVNVKKMVTNSMKMQLTLIFNSNLSYIIISHCLKSPIPRLHEDFSIFI